MLLHARSAARLTADGSLARLAEQDRRRRDRCLIAEGQAIVRACVQRGRPGPYQIQAAINAVHSVAPSFDSTDWHAILTLYDQLYALTPTPVVALNRAVALAEAGASGSGRLAIRRGSPRTFSQQSGMSQLRAWAARQGQSFVAFVNYPLLLGVPHIEGHSRTGR